MLYVGYRNVDGGPKNFYRNVIVGEDRSVEA